MMYDPLKFTLAFTGILSLGIGLLVAFMYPILAREQTESQTKLEVEINNNQDCDTPEPIIEYVTIPETQVVYEKVQDSTTKIIPCGGIFVIETGNILVTGLVAACESKGEIKYTRVFPEGKTTSSYTTLECKCK